MSRRLRQLREKLNRLVAAEIRRGTPEDEIIGALEIVKCNVAIAAAHTNAQLNKNKQKPDTN